MVQPLHVLGAIVPHCRHALSGFDGFREQYECAADCSCPFYCWTDVLLRGSLERSDSKLIDFLIGLAPRLSAGVRARSLRFANL